jgi:uncharacterized repeat protein (TIGR01451 family)/fimbrial isopeptide formation D2 family protein
MSFLLTNPNAGTVLSGIGFTDTLPTGLTAPNGTTAQCNGGSLVITGGDTLTFTSGTLTASANCTITVTVTGVTASVKNNTTGTISSTEGGTGATSNTATVTVVAPPTIAKSFGVPSIALTGTTSMSFLLTNPNAGTALSGIGFTDTLPTGLTAPNGTTAQCNGGSLVITGANTLTFTGGTLTGGTNCTVTVTVTGTTSGVKNNTTGAISSTEGGTGTTSNTATLSVGSPAPPTIAKSFGAASIALNGTTTMSFLLTNSNASALSGIAFTDTLPAGLTAPNGTTAQCNGGSLVITSGNTLTFTAGTLATNANCTITVTITGTTSGVKNNTTGAISSTEGGTGATSNTATVTVVAPPTIAKSFGAASIALNGTTTMSFLLTNPNASALSGIAFIDTLPAGLTAPNGTTAQCNGGSLVITGANTLTFTGGTLTGGTNCTITVTVTGATSGVKNNTTGAISSTESGPGTTSNTATVSVAVTAPPTIAKSFGVASIALNGTTSMSFLLTNPNAGALSGIAFTDTLPAGLTAPNGTTAQCNGGSLVITGGNTLSFTGGTLPASTPCTITVTVTGVIAGVQNNTTGTISSTESGVGGTSNTAAVTVVAPPTIAKSFGVASIALNGTTSMSFLLTNPNAATTLSGINFTDTLPAGLTAPNGTTAFCGGSLVITGANTLTFTAGTLAANANCMITVTVTGTTAGVKNNTTSAISSTESGTGPTSNTATVSVAVTAPPTIAKSFGAASIALSGTTSMSFLLTNPNASALSGIAFTDTLPAGLTAPNGTTAFCGGSLVVTGANTLTFTAGALAANATCTITVTVTGTTAGVKNNTTAAISSTESGPGPTSNTATVSVSVPASPTIAKSFGAASIALNATTSMSFLLTNPNTSALSGIAFTDTLPVGLTAPNGTTAFCGGSLVITGGNTLTFTAGTLAANANCTITVTVAGTTAGVKNNTTGAIGSTESGSGKTSNTATVSVGVPNTPAPNLIIIDPVITKQVDVQLALPGDPVTYTITATNNGNASATGVIVTDPIPAQLQIENITTTQGTVAISGNTLTINIGTVGPGQTVTMKIFARVRLNVTPPTDVLNTAYEYYNEGPSRTASSPFGSRTSSATIRVTKGSLPGTGEHPGTANFPWALVTGLVALIGLIMIKGVFRKFRESPYERIQ